MPFTSEAFQQRVSGEKYDHMHRTHVFLGYHPETGDDLLLKDGDRYMGVYALGVQGTGKSSLLENMIAFDHQANNAIIVIDPHGDLITHCLAELPPHRLPHTYILDLEDEAFPFGVNVFAVGRLTTSIAQAQAVERIMHIFEVLWPDVLAQHNLPRYVRAATITLLANPGSTLVDMHKLLLDDSVRRALLQNVTDPSVLQFWQTQYDDVSNAERLRRVQPLIGRLESLFMGRSLIKNIVGQRQTTINFRKAIENHEVIFVRLPLKSVKQDAQLIGTMLLSQIHAAVFSFANVPEKQRPGVSLYVDEVQNFATPDFAELFTEGRKFGVKLTVAHQYRSQLPAFLRDSTMTARTKICFQTTPEDGKEMAHVFPPQEEAVKLEDVEPHPVNYLLTYGYDEPSVRQFIERYLRPMQTQKHGGKVDINGTHLTFNWWSGIKQRDDLYVSDPTPYLDSLLYQVMKSGNPEVPIPVDAVLGFANCERGFFSAARGLSARDKILMPDAMFPNSLVVMGPDNTPRWTRPPETATEQLYHFLFHLRMTLFALADNPIGKKTAPSTTIVGQMLTQLPRRSAFVRSGETVGVIYTNDTPERIRGRDLMLRAQTVLEQTRQKYCHPRADVNRPVARPTSNGARVATPPKLDPMTPGVRWEEV